MTTTDIAVQDTAAPAESEVLEVTPGMADMAELVKDTAEQFVNAVRTGQASMVTASEMLIRMIDHQHHLFATDPATGRAFTSLAAYTEHLAGAGAFPEMIAATRDLLMDKLHAAGKLEGMSKRVVAAITNQSESNAVKIKQAAKRRATPPAPPEAPLEGAAKEAAELKEAQEKVARDVKLFGALVDRLLGADQHITEQEWNTLTVKGAELNTRRNKLVKLNAERERIENLSPAERAEREAQIAAERDAVADAEREADAAGEAAPDLDLVGAPVDPTAVLNTAPKPTPRTRRK